MTERLNKRLKQIIHSLGFSCLGGAIFLQLLVFLDILRQGYFMAVENNQAILTLEISLAFFALIYYLYMYRNFMRSLR